MRGHKLIVETKAGQGIGASDEAYAKAGATIIDTAKEVWEKADMVIKVKEPIQPEYALMKPNLILYTYLHLAAEPELTKQLMERKVKARQRRQRRIRRTRASESLWVQNIPPVSAREGLANSNRLF
jgi:alanine dehydrogenase